MSEVEPPQRHGAARMTLRKQVRNSIIVGAGIGLVAAAVILRGAIAKNSQLEYYDTAAGEVFWGYILLNFASIFVYFLVGGIAIYWLIVLLGRVFEVVAGPPDKPA